MNTSKIRKALEIIDRQTDALKWLTVYGKQITGKIDAVEAVVTIHPYLGGDQDGVRHAAQLLQSYSLINLPAIVDQSINCCRNDIEIARETIRRELDATGTSDAEAQP